MKAVGTGILVTNAYIAALATAAWIVPLPTEGPGYNAVLGVTVLVAIATVLLMAIMIVHMLRSGMEAGQKFTWCAVFLATAFVGTTVYYLLAYRQSPKSGAKQDSTVS